MELLQTIALLCQVSITGAFATTTDKNQLLCQKYYIECMKVDKLDLRTRLELCVLNRKL